MDVIKKALAKLTNKERTQVEAILKKLLKGNSRGLDIKKLKSRNDIFRVRKGTLRILYRTTKKEDIFILAIEKRSDTTYNKL